MPVYAYLAQAKGSFCKKNGAEETLQFLTEHFSLLGFDGQYWMLIVVGLVAVFIPFARNNRDRP